MAVFPEYTPSPEAQYPIAIEQAYAATNWVGELPFAKCAAAGVPSSWINGSR
jgi:acetyl esterase/lipase